LNNEIWIFVIRYLSVWGQHNRGILLVK
jgi:hypothetical protein